MRPNTKSLLYARRDKEPDVPTLTEWMDRGGCEAVDGCWVEPDGRCPHGYDSWAIVLGLI